MKILDTQACEFGYELIMVLPYAYYLHTNNIPFKVKTCKGMESFYYFLSKEQIEIKYLKRRGSLPAGTYLKTIHFNSLDKTEWLMPPFVDKFSRDIKFKTKFKKEVLVISNKFTSEWGHNPVNFLPLEVLDVLFEGLTKLYTVVYNRPLSKNITEDHSVNMELGDYELISQKYPQVVNLNDLYHSEDLDFNTLQLALGASTRNFISVQGGNSILNSLFGGTNLVFARKGSELTHNSFKGWYGELGGSTVIDTDNYAELITLVQKYFIDERI